MNLNNGKVFLEDFGKKESMYVTSSKKTTNLMMEMSPFWQDQPKRRISFGANCRNFRKKREKKVAFWTWRQRLFPL